MYTNGLKDRFGSPLISLKQGDERYVMMNQIEFSHAKIEEKVESLGKHVYKNQDDITDLKNKNYNTNVVLNAHRKNEEEHFTEDEKKEYKEINELVLGVYPTFDFSTNQTDYTGETEAYSIQLDKADFIPGGSIIQEIRLPYKAEFNNAERYCHIIVFDSNSTQIGKTFVSEGTTARTTGSNEVLVSKWKFDNKVLPEDYAFVRIALSRNATLTNLNGDSNFRINVSRNANNQNINPTNLSKLLLPTQSYLGWVEVTAVSTEKQNIKEEFTSIIDNLSIEIRTQFGESFENLREDIGEDYLTKTEASETYATNDNLETNYYNKEESVDVFVSKEEFDELLEQSSQKQQYYDTWTNLKDGDIVDKAGTYSFQLDKNDFTTGRIDRIEIPYIAGANATGHLCVQFFNSSNSAIATYYSINKQTQDKTGEHTRGICEYEFSTFETPAAYSYVRFSMVANTGTVPTGNSGISFRIMPIKRSNTFTWNTNTNTKVNNTGNRWTILVSVLTRNYAKNTGITVRTYDWTPDVFCPITVTLSTAGAAFVAPTNGWIVSKSTQSTSGANSLTLNGIEIGASGSSAQSDLQVLIRKGEFITATTAYNLVFYPCKSEQFDYRLEGGHTPYDIWKGAVVYDEYGQPSVKDLYIPNASAWKSEVGSAVNGRIDNINGEEARDASGNVLFNIQTRYIEVANETFSGTSMKTISNTTWDVLRSAEAMFASSQLTGWNNNLPALQQGYCMFYNSGSFTSFTGSLSALGDGMRMFTNCSALTNVSITGTMTNLWRGTEMFKGCSLSYTSLNNILNALPQTTESGRTIEITVADSVKDDMLSDAQWQGVSIPAYNSGNYYELTHNGWRVRLTSRTGFSVVNETEYDISEANGNTQVTGEWYMNVASPAGLNIVRVIDGIAYDE